MDGSIARTWQPPGLKTPPCSWASMNRRIQPATPSTSPTPAAPSAPPTRSAPPTPFAGSPSGGVGTGGRVALISLSLAAGMLELRAVAASDD